MRNRASFLSIALLLTAAAAMAQRHSNVDSLRLLLNRPILWATPPERMEARPEMGESLEWRALTMRDEHGQIPPGARYQANLERRKALADKGRLHGLEALSANITPASWVSRGPQNCGGRTRALLVLENPSDPQKPILYAGAATGGVWKSLNGGDTWFPLTDFMTNINISTMVMDPNVHNTIYVGTGEGEYSQHGPDGLPGAGIFKTIDGGTTWTPLSATADWRYVRELSAHPTISGVLLAANELGVWRSGDGGTSWTQVHTGAANIVAFNPHNGDRAVADTTVDGHRALLYSTDGGFTFSPAAIPNSELETSNLAAAWGPGCNVYVNIENKTQGKDGELWHSSDGGAGYSVKSASGQDTTCIPSCAVWVSPDNPEIIVTGGFYLKRSMNGGQTFTILSNGPYLGDDPHLDTHFLAHDPSNHNRLYVAGDGGVYVTEHIESTPSNPTWANRNFTYQTSQFYSAAGISQGSGLIFIGGTHDNGTLRVFESSATVPPWVDGDGGFVAIDPINPNTMYGERLGQNVVRSTDGGFTGQDIRPGTDPMVVTPLIMDPNDRNTLLSGGMQLSRTKHATESNPTWNTIPIISTGSLISAIAVAKGNSNIIWIGHSDGSIQKTTTGLADNPVWSYVDVSLPDRAVLRIVVDPDDSNRVYVALGGYTANSSTPQNLWRTTDGGSAWQPISGSWATALPRVPVRTIARHPRNQQRLYVGTDIGIYESEDGGGSWSTSQQGPADVTVDELSFIYGTETLLAATHGRGLWTADTSSVPTYSPSVPTGLLARATATTAIDVSWSAMAGATNYQLFRSVDGAPYSERALLQSTFFTDTVQANKTYLYKVRAYKGTWSDLSAPELATTVLFDHDNTLGGQFVTAAVMQQLYTGVNAVLSAAGMTPSLTAPGTGTPITAASLINLRTALTNAYSAIGMPVAPSFSPFGAGSPVLAAFVQEVREPVK